MSQQCISGLGIDMGPPIMSASASRKRSQTISNPQEYTESLNQYNNNRRHSQLLTRHPITSSSASDRKVRIASCQPGILGSRNRDANDSDASSYQEPKRYVSGPMNRNKLLSAAVAAVSNQDWNRSSSATPSDFYSSEASPDTESSATSYTSGSSSLKRNMTVRKQRSQPDLSRASTLIRTETLTKSALASSTSHGPPRPATSAMSRSQSSTDFVARQAQVDSGSGTGSTSLGRSKEIPRSGSRGALYGRGAGGASSSRGRHTRSATCDPRSAAQAILDNDTPTGLVPDGFGGFVEPKKAKQQVKMPSEKSSKGTPSDREDSQQSPVREQPSRPLPTQSTQPSHPTQPDHRRLSSQNGTASFRVGTFYGPDGSERARLDEDGRLSKMGSSQGKSSDGQSSSYSSSSYMTSSSQRSRALSQSGPRPQFMNSPSASGGSLTEGEESQSGKSDHSQRISHVRVRSHSQKFLRGLEGAEKGEAMVSLDSLNESFHQGDIIEPSKIKANNQGSILASPPRPVSPRHVASEGNVGSSHMMTRNYTAPVPGAMIRSMTDTEVTMGKKNNSQLERQHTLISTSANPARRSKELNRLLANNGRKLTSASSSAGDSISSASADSLASTKSLSRSGAIGQYSMPPAVLEQGRSGKNRVDVDLVLESDLVVEGGYLRGRLEIKVRKESDKDGALMLTQPKVRVVGFEELLNDDTRHIFYHHAAVIDGSPKIGSGASQPYVLHGTPSLSPEADNRQLLACFSSPADSEGYCIAREGTHSVPFAMELPIGKGAKGSYRGKHAIVRYIVIGSVKLKSANGSNRSIAHFYRHVELFPYLNPAVILSSSARPTQARASKGLFLGGNGKVHLSASLHRSTWVAGQRVYLNIKIDNETSKKVKSLTLALVRTVTLFRPRPEFDMGGSAPDDPSETYVDPDACTTSTSRKKITEEILEMGQKGTKGVVTAKGWWTGVEGGEIVEFSHNMKLPVDALTITRGRHVEVLYSIKVSISSSLSSDVSVELPVRVINFVSLDPPPLKSSTTKVTRNWNRENHQRNAMSELEAPMIEKMRVMGSPAGLNAGLGLEPANQSHHPPPPVQPAALQLPYRTSIDNQLQIPGGDRKLQHQKSLDFINHAIRSATARKTRSNEPSPTGLGIGLDENRTPPGGYSSAASSSGSSMVSSVAGPAHPSCAPYKHPYQSATAPVYQAGRGLYQHPVNLPINMGDLEDDDGDDDSDDDLGVGNQTLNLNDESVDEVDFVIGSARLDGGESSPEFQQRHEFGSDQYLMSMDEEEGDSSTSTVTSQRGIREKDEYDEEEERLMEQQSRQLQSYSLQAPAINQDDEPTPLAHSPPKFASNNTSSHHGLAALPRTKPSIPRMRESYEDSEDDYLSSTSSRRSVVRTKADDEDPRLGRSSTIIRGPSGDISRPVSPSKQAPSPTKSALKSKSSFSYASTNEGPFKSGGSITSTKPLTLKAKVSYSQIPKAVPRGVASQSSAKRPTIVRSSDSESSCSASPASSLSPLTPESAYSEIAGEVASNYEHEQVNELTGLGLNLQPVDVTPKKTRTSNSEIAASLPESKSSPTLARSTSVHNLRGSNVVVPSVRDKIAMLENRKQALRDFTGSSSPANNNAETPTKMTSSGSRTFNNDSTTTTLTRKQGVSPTRQLERNDSYLSDSSSQADYLKHTPSISSFKAPLFTSNQDLPPMPVKP